MDSQSAGQRAEPLPQARRTVLVAGGTDTRRASVGGHLAAHGFAVQLANDDRAALAALEVQSPDAVILADALPTFDALAVCRRLQAHAGSHSTPIAVLLPSNRTLDSSDALPADVLSSESTADDLLAWVRRRFSPAAPAGTWWRLALAHVVTDHAAPDPELLDSHDVTWRLLFEHLDDGAALVDGDGRIRMVNRSLGRLLGLASPQTCQGLHLLDVLPKASVVSSSGAVTGPPTVTTTIRKGHGRPRAEHHPPAQARDPGRAVEASGPAARHRRAGRLTAVPVVTASDPFGKAPAPIRFDIEGQTLGSRFPVARTHGGQQRTLGRQRPARNRE